MWTDERVATLRECWAEGLSAREIADRLGGVTRNGVLGKLHRAGLCSHSGQAKSLAAKMQAKRRKIKAAAEPKPVAAPAPKPAPPPTPAPVIAAPPEPDVARVASVLDLEHNHCRWPVGDPLQGFCGLPRAEIGGKLKPYCADHCCRAYSGRPAHTPPAPMPFQLKVSAVGNVTRWA